MKIIALLAMLQSGDAESKFRDGWSKLREAWKSITEYHGQPHESPAKKVGEDAPKPDDLPDDLLRVLGRAMAAMGDAGLWEKEVAPDLAAVRSVLKTRLAGMVRPAGRRRFFDTPQNDADTRRLEEEYSRLERELTEAYTRAYEEYSRRQEGEEKPDKAEKKVDRGELEEAIAGLAKTLSSSVPAEDLVQDAVARVRKCLRDAGIFDEETPAWLRVRITNLVKALTLGERMPEAPKATPEQEKRIGELLDALEGEEIERRADAMRELHKLGEVCVPFASKRLAETEDADVRISLRRFLGYRDKK